MKKMLLFLLIPSLLLADDSVKYLNKDDKAPFDGYLFSREAERQLRLTDLELKQSKDIIKLYEQKSTIQEKQIELRDKELDVLSKRVIEQKDDSFFGKIGFFVLGVAATSAIAFGITRISR